MLQSLYNLAESFPATPMIASREMRRLLDTDRTGFTEAVMSLCKTKTFAAGHQYALTLLVTNNLIVDRLADTRGLEAQEAIEIARKISTSIDSFIDVKLIRLLVSNNGAPATITDSPTLLRVLEVIGAISDGSRIMTMLTQLLQHTDMRVRSKVALLIGRINHNLKWVEQRLGETDGRVRANAIESLWGMDSPDTRQIFQLAIDDSDNRVAGNGALGLYRCGDLTAAEALVKMLAREEPKFRATAAWAMGETADPRFLTQLSLRIAETDPNVRQNVFRAISKIRKRVKEIQDIGKLSVVITRSEVEGPERRINLAVVRGPGQHLPKLNPVELVISDGGSVVNRLSMQTRREAEHIVAGFVLPRLISREDAMGQALLDTMRVFLRQKRKLDSWTATKYAATVAAPTIQVPTFRLESALLSSGSGAKSAAKPVAVAESEGARDLEPIRFTTDPRAVLQMCESVGMRSACPDSAQESLNRLFEAMATVRGHKSAFVFVTERSSRGWADCLAHAREARTAVHALGCQAAIPEDLIRVCVESGGTVTMIESVEKMPPACERVAASLASLYTIRYEIPKSEKASPADGEPRRPNELKVQIFTEHGFGEDAIQG